MGIKACFYFVFLCFSLTARAEVTIVGVGSSSTYSAVTGLLAGDVNFTNVSVYGGVAGESNTGACASASSVSTCNNCVENGSGPNAPCSSRRVHENLSLTVTFTTTSRGRLLLYAGPPVRSEIQTQYFEIDDFTSVAKTEIVGSVDGTETSVVFTVSWQVLCRAFADRAATEDGKTDDDINCDNFSGDNIPNDLSGELFFGIDANNNGAGSQALELNSTEDDYIAQAGRRLLIEFRSGRSNDGDGNFSDILGGNDDFCQSGAANGTTGLCNFTAYSGDEKVYFDDIQTLTSLNQSEYSAVRAYYEEFGTPVTIQSDFKDMEIPLLASTSAGETIGVETNEVTGFANDLSYHFRLALVDIAGNVLSMTPAPTSGPSIESDKCYTQGTTACHHATPGEVVGLLEREFDCFIATAAYGSALEPQVQTFRKFRNHFLHPYTAGRWLIRKYYKYSPYWARALEAHPQWKPVVRAGLYPFWFVSWLLLQQPFLGVLWLGVLVLLMGWQRGLRYRRQRGAQHSPTRLQDVSDKGALR